VLSRVDTLNVPRVPDQVPCVRRGNRSGHEPGQMTLRLPLIQRRRQQELLARVEATKRLVHRTANHRGRAHRLDIEQSLIITVARHNS
jgi:hypothetical protein